MVKKMLGRACRNAVFFLGCFLLLAPQAVMAQDGASAPALSPKGASKSKGRLPTAAELAGAGPLKGGAASSALPSPAYKDEVKLGGEQGQQGGSVKLSGPFAELEPEQKTPEQIEAEIRKEAFNAAITGLLPMRPEEIRKLLETYDKTREAIEKPIYPYPSPEIVVETIALDPGATPPKMKVAVGHVASLNILDVTGAPWPVQDLTYAGEFEVIQPEEGGHIIRITPLAEFAHGNLVVRLVRLKTPVVFTLETHRDVVQYRFDARIPEFGPYAEMPLIEGGITLVAGSPLLNAILDGVPPEGAVRLDVTGTDGRTTAYRFNENTYVRTPLTLLSPGWSSSVSSADGMNVYTLKEAPVLLLSDGGHMVRARVSEGDATDE